MDYLENAGTIYFPHFHNVILDKWDALQAKVFSLILCLIGIEGYKWKLA